MSLRAFGTVIFEVMLLCLLASISASAQGFSPVYTTHADPLNFDPVVRDGYNHFYNLDYEGAIQRFDQVIAAHPKEPIAYAYQLQAVIFRALYHADLLDTTYYAHDNFLTNQRKVDIPGAERQRIEALTSKTLALADERLKANPQDTNALFARGFAKGLHAAYMTLADHSWFAAARQGLSSRGDSEQVIKLDPQYYDADMAIGIQQFAVASLPGVVRMVVGIAGVGGNKEKGLDLLKLSAEKGTITSIESRTTLSLFLRHDGRYKEALAVQHALATQFPHDYLFRLEEANLAKDKGDGLTAIAAYRQVLADAAKPGYFVDPRLQMAYFGLAETERGQNMIADAARDYLAAAGQPVSSDWLRKRAELNAGEMLDLAHDRNAALVQYRKAADASGDQSQADAARRYLKTPFPG